MDREGVDARIVVEDGGRAVPLVHVEVDHGDALGETLRLDDAGRHGEVVQIAEALGLLREGVVEPTPDVGGPARLQGCAGREDRPAAGESKEGNDLRGHRELAHHRPLRVAAGGEILEVGPSVHEQELLVRGGLGSQRPIEAVLLVQARMRQAVLLDREDMGPDVGVGRFRVDDVPVQLQHDLPSAGLGS